MGWLERQPLRILDWNIKERQNGRRDRPKIAIECEDLPGYLSPNVLVRVAIGTPAVLAGVSMGILRLGDISLRAWMVVAARYARRPRVLITGGGW